MINETANYFEKAAKQLGLTIQLPRPSKKMKASSAITNGLLGVGLITSGVVFKKAPLTVLGVLGVAGAVMLAIEE
ncbi:hypothetical protein [Candidatus Enterococcus ferrettii]|uniref:DUF2892 domain-containing protein n=1 Tax=Candidatus Enterococcus ferrettii TaxID=2815324 RepID=A0ABV0EV23_9ENTE|nr:hypothetical protein [Enterococcus sp. 665A]MBO1341676.1 hypothetical protein [Enterococcus sp. 665A]